MPALAGTHAMRAGASGHAGGPAVYMRNDVDCFRAAFATLAGVDYEDLPDLTPQPGMLEAYERWAVARGKRVTVHPIDALPVDRERWLGLIRVPATDFVQATSPDGFNRHTVVMRYGELLHDPLPYRDAEHDRLVRETGIAVGLTLDDEFDEAHGNLSGKTLPVGGTWATSGAATDIAVETAVHTAQRSTISDSGSRVAIAGTTTLTDVVVQVDVESSDWVSALGAVNAYLLARYTDSSNYVYALLFQDASGPQIAVQINAGGSVILNRAFKIPGAPLKAATWYTLRLYVDAGGRWIVSFGQQGAALLAMVANGSDSSLATGGALASGKVGFADRNSSATAATRNFDNFAAWVPVPDVVLFSGRQAEFRAESYVRQNAAGTGWADKTVEGNYPRLMPAGRENRQNRIVIDTCRNDPETMFDPSLSKTQLQIVYVPRYRSIPAG